MRTVYIFTVVGIMAVVSSTWLMTARKEGALEAEPRSSLCAPIQAKCEAVENDKLYYSGDLNREHLNN